MADLPLLLGSSRIESSDFVNNDGTDNVIAGSANTKGSWDQFIASTSFDYEWILIGLWHGTGTTNSEYLVDIGIGAAASEQVLVENLYGCLDGNSTSDESWVVKYLLPVHVPAGSRIAVRCQSALASAEVDVQFFGIAGSPVVPVAGLVSTYGADTSASEGTRLDPGASTASKGPWNELTSSTERQHSMMFIAFGFPDDLAWGSAIRMGLDIAIGAASSEEIIISDLILHSHGSSSDQGGNNLIGLPVQIPAGTRISARLRTSNTSLDPTCILHCV